MPEPCDCGERKAVFALAVLDYDGRIIEQIDQCGDCILALLPDEFGPSTIERLKRNG
jgi:hypothetical protein